jgi:putative ABC transport system permease protein
MTTLAPPPAPIDTAPPVRRRGPARRAIRRWAWRMLRREWRQQALVVLLLIVAVAGTTIGLGLVVNVQRGDLALFGNANARLDIGSTGRAGVARDLIDARRRYGTVEAIVHEQVPVPGSITPVDLRGQNPHGVFSAPMVQLMSGRYPNGNDEAAVSSAVATTFNLKLGSTWTVDGRALHIVGTVENPNNLQDGFGLVLPGVIRAPSGLTLLFDSDPNAIMRYHPPAGNVLGISSSGATSAQQQRNQALAVLTLATIGLTFIGLLAVAGFTVMAQRRLRALGMIAAIGATDRQVRRVMLANGAAVGVVGATGGVLIGLAVWLALTPAFENVVGHRYDPFALPWWAVAGGAVLAVLTSIVASWWPARGVAKIPIVAALSGRPAPPQPAHRFAMLGTALAASGFVCLVLSHADHPALIIAGILTIATGMLLLAPLGIRAVALVAARAPVAVRLALRDLARYQARSGAALAAASLAVGIGATVAINAAAQQADDRTLSAGNLANDQLIVWLADPNNPNGPPVSAAPTAGRAGKPALPSAAVVRGAYDVAAAIARNLDADTTLALGVAADLTSDVPAGAPPGAGQVGLVHPITETGHHGWTQVTVPYVATPALLAFYGIAPSSQHADILTARADLGGVQVGSGSGRTFRDATVQHTSHLPSYSSAPNTLITAQAIRDGHYTAEPVGWLLQARAPLTQAQITNARDRAAAAGVTIETRTGPSQNLQHLRDYSTLTGLLVALGVLAMTVGLIRSETTQDLRTLTATGAGSRTRRTLHAATAGVLGLLAGILGTAGSYLALIAWNWHDVGYLSHPPYLDLAVLVVGLPAVAAASAWLLSRTPTAIARRPLE